jgi:hypothetical protein
VLFPLFHISAHGLASGAKVEWLEILLITKVVGLSPDPLIGYPD